LFRCLALQAGEGESSLERAATAYFERYIVETSQAREDFCGVDLTELISVEELFSVSIYVYSLDEHNQAVCIRRSVKQFPSMYINLYENHFSFIKDFHSYSNCFVCKKCDKIFSKPYALSRHEQTCTTNVRHKFPGRVFQIPKTVFQELEDMGLQFEPADKFFPILPHGISRAFNMMCGLHRAPHHFNGQLNMYQRLYLSPVTCLVTKMHFVL
jgi:hypothetical protein